ncbi:MAG: hypothetical protein KAS95_05575 [Candidatus Heimdallarchaeota archaeon]|nr:hypothetical protein [Candidatus Heimdallarchaeota archaeon]
MVAATTFLKNQILTEVKVKEPETFYTSLQKLVKNAKRFLTIRKVEQINRLYPQKSIDELLSIQKYKARATIMLNCPYL